HAYTCLHGHIPSREEAAWTWRTRSGGDLSCLLGGAGDFAFGPWDLANRKRAGFGASRAAMGRAANLPIFGRVALLNFGVFDPSCRGFSLHLLGSPLRRL